LFVKRSEPVPVTCEPGVTRKVLAWSEALMMCEICFEKGARGKVHAHPHTQVSYVAKGSFKFMVGDEERLVSRGDSILIPPDTLHGVEALEEAMLVDVFAPARQDFVQSIKL
jgi:quercetin dioxygenase-like cupin family protein